MEAGWPYLMPLHQMSFMKINAFKRLPLTHLLLRCNCNVRIWEMLKEGMAIPEKGVENDPTTGQFLQMLA